MRKITFFDTHVRSKLTVAKILSETKIRIEVYVSEVKNETDKLSYIKLNLSKGRRLLAKNLVSVARYIDKIALGNDIEINANYDSIQL